jgi:hypothetical protein
LPENSIHSGVTETKRNGKNRAFGKLVFPDTNQSTKGKNHHKKVPAHNSLIFIISKAIFINWRLTHLLLPAGGSHTTETSDSAT